MLRGVVLCGGLSRRMGTPKALLSWAGGNLLGHAVARLAAAGLEPVCAGPAAWAEETGCRPLADDPPGAGPLGGIAAALAEGDCFVLAVDMPLLTAREIALLTELGLARGRALVPVLAGREQPLAAFWPGDLVAPLRRHLAAGHREVLGFLASVPHLPLTEGELVRSGIVPGHLRGFNTRDGYLELLSLSQAEGGGES